MQIPISGNEGTMAGTAQHSDLTHPTKQARQACTPWPHPRGLDRLGHRSDRVHRRRDRGGHPELAAVLGIGRLGRCGPDCDGSPAAHGLRRTLIGLIVGALDDIIAGVREDLAVQQRRVPLDRLKERCQHIDPAIDPMPRFRGPGVAVIAEVKRSSPSKGSLAEIADPAALAVEYEAGGAAAISVLTEQRHFAGSLDDLVRVRCAVDIPVLRKDFVVTAYQLFEARAAGADLVLLIVAALSDPELVSLVERARSIGLTPLVEAHTADEVRRAVDAGATIIGVNARNLQTLQGRALDLQPGSRR